LDTPSYAAIPNAIHFTQKVEAFRNVDILLKHYAASEPRTDLK